MFIKQDNEYIVGRESVHCIPHYYIERKTALYCSMLFSRKRNEWVFMWSNIWPGDPNEFYFDTYEDAERTLRRWASKHIKTFAKMVAESIADD